MVAQDLFWRRMGGAFPPYDAPLSAEEEMTSEGRRSLGLVLAYDGGPFVGWQVQPKGPTIQGVIEKALGKLCNEPVRVTASGRTDNGVHAWGQVASFTTASKLPLERMLAGLRSLLPPQIHVRALGNAPAKFHARYDAKAKTYNYYLWPSSQGHLFLEGRVWAVDKNLSRERISDALSRLLGPCDMKALASQGCEVKGGTVREVLAASLVVEPSGLWRVSLTATGFLRHVVRNLVGTMVQIGAERLAPSDLGDMLSAGVRFHPGPKAPPGGLYLSRVYYRSPVEPGDE